MNAEAILMDKAGILNTTSLAIEAILRATYPKTSSSNEIFNLLPNPIQRNISAISNRYSRGPCSKPAAYTGTAAAMLCKSNPAFYHEYSYHCPVLNRIEDGFRQI